MMQTFLAQKLSFQGFIQQKIVSVLTQIQLWMDRYHQRKQLAQLSDQLMNDLGLSQSDVYIEIRKPFWK